MTHVIDLLCCGFTLIARVGRRALVPAASNVARTGGVPEP
jgi:hypothetical protein